MAGNAIDFWNIFAGIEEVCLTFFMKIKGPRTRLDAFGKQLFFVQ
jgi:hypothetical protein